MSESQQSKCTNKKESLEIKDPSITDLESPSVETTKGISTSTSGDSISVSVSESTQCNGHESPVKEDGGEGKGEDVVDGAQEGAMDQEPVAPQATVTHGTGELPEGTGLEQGDGDRADTIPGTLGDHSPLSRLSGWKSI